MKDTVQINNEVMIDLTLQRSTVYGCLARIYRKEITSDFLPSIRDPQFLGVLSDLGSELDAAWFERPEDEVIEDLAVEYTRLFLGPDKHISPHESIHHERGDGDWGSFWGASTVEVKKFIEAAGLQYRDDYRDLPDHISVELEFMQKVTEGERNAWEEGDTDRALYCLNMEKRFLEEHLTKWIPRFCDAVISQAKLPFYREMANITKRFIAFEKDNSDAYISEAHRGKRR